jgi:hypothetical protein
MALGLISGAVIFAIGINLTDEKLTTDGKILMLAFAAGLTGLACSRICYSAIKPCPRMGYNV